MISKKTILIYWVFFFIFYCGAFTLIRYTLIPKMNWNAIGGNLAGDPQLYEKAAQKQVLLIEKNGLSEFQLHPDSSGPAGVMSLLYLFNNNQISIIILNAIIHSIAIIMCFLILNNWFSPKISLFSILPMLLSPYLLVWFSQINKDSYSLLGVMFFFYGLAGYFKIKNTQFSLKSTLTPLSSLVASILVFYLVRPYLNQINIGIFFILFCFSLIIFKYKKQKKIAAVSFLSLLVFSALFCSGATSDQTLSSFTNFSEKNIEQMAKLGVGKKRVYGECLRNISTEVWQRQILPEFADNKFKSMFGQRCLNFILFITDKNPTTLDSIVDYDILPASTLEALKYIPRALMLGIFAPWPNQWLLVLKYPSSTFYRIVPIESLLFYLSLLLIFIWSYKNKTMDFFIILTTSFVFMGAYGASTPFLGALYRYKYPWWMFIISIGVSIFITYLSKFKPTKFLHFWKSNRL